MNQSIKQDIPEASCVELEELMQNAEYGDADSQFLLAERYVNGDGVPQDHTQALNWYCKAMEQGHVAAENNFEFWAHFREGKMAHYSYYQTHVEGVAYEDRVPYFSIPGNHGRCESVWLRHQPEYPYDNSAIQVVTPDLREIGFIPNAFASLVADTLDSVEAHLEAYVLNVNEADYPNGYRHWDIAFRVPNPQCSTQFTSASIIRVELSHSLAQVTVGKLFVDTRGRFFVTEIKGDDLHVVYEDGRENQSYTIAMLQVMARSWPCAIITTIRSIQDGFRAYGLRSSDNPFADYDRLAAIEREHGMQRQLQRIQQSAQLRKRLLAMRRRVIATLYTNAFFFGEHPPYPTHSGEQIRAANSELQKLDASSIRTAFIGFYSVLLVLGVAFSGYSPDYPLLLQILGRFIFVGLLLAAISIPLWFIALPSVVYIEKFLVSRARSSTAANAVQIKDACQATANRWNKFLCNERERYKSWNAGYRHIRDEYIEAFVIYLSIRAYSPWAIDVRKIRSSLDKRYPDKGIHDVDAMEPWQKAVWETAHSYSHSTNDIDAFVRSLSET